MIRTLKSSQKQTENAHLHRDICVYVLIFLLTIAVRAEKFLLTVQVM